MARKAQKCLMIETPDNKKFFTFEKNYTQILDFAKSFNCEISTVKLEDGKILDLTKLAKAITCDEIAQKPKFEIIKKIQERKRRNRARS